MLYVGIAIGVVLTLGALHVIDRAMFAHPDKATCMSCDKHFNTRTRSYECPHRKLSRRETNDATKSERGGAG